MRGLPADQAQCNKYRESQAGCGVAVAIDAEPVTPDAKGNG